MIQGASTFDRQSARGAGPLQLGERPKTRGAIDENRKVDWSKVSRIQIVRILESAMTETELFRPNWGFSTRRHDRGCFGRTEAFGVGLLEAHRLFS